MPMYLREITDCFVGESALLVEGGLILLGTPSRGLHLAINLSTLLRYYAEGFNDAPNQS